LEYIGFETQLVGVRDNNTPLQSGLIVRWKSNAMGNAGGVFGVGGTNSTDVRRYVSGGIFDVEIATVPEPATWLLFVVAATAIGGRHVGAVGARGAVSAGR
jgi:hypothetical protein